MRRQGAVAMPSSRAGFGSFKEHKMTGADEDDKHEAVRQAERFGHVRDAHQRELAEDYVELIADLIAQSSEVPASWIWRAAFHVGFGSALAEARIEGRGY